MHKRLRCHPGPHPDSKLCGDAEQWLGMFWESLRKIWGLSWTCKFSLDEINRRERKRRVRQAHLQYSQGTVWLQWRDHVSKKREMKLGIEIGARYKGPYNLRSGADSLHRGSHRGLLSRVLGWSRLCFGEILSGSIVWGEGVE